MKTTHRSATGGKNSGIRGDHKILQYASVDIDVPFATLNADDGTGISVGSVEIIEATSIIRAYLNITQGSGDAGDTLELIVNDTDDGVTPVTTLVAAQDCAAASLLNFAPASSTTVPLPKTSVTNKFVVALFKDVTNDGNASTDLVGKLVVEYDI